MAERQSNHTRHRRTLRQGNEELRARLAEAEETLLALRSGEVDAIVIETPAGPSVFTLKGAEHAYRIIVETMTEGAVTTSLDGTVLYANPCLARILGVNAGSVMGRPLADFLVPEERPRFGELLGRARSGPATGRFLIQGEGRPRTLYFSTALLHQEGEEERICLVVTDLTEQEAAAEKLRQAQAEKEVLQRSEAQFRLLAEAVPQIVWTALPDGSMDYFNRKWAEFSGVSQEEGLGQAWRAIVHPEDREPTVAAWQRSVIQGLPYEMEHRLRQTDGEYRWHLSRALPLKDKNGRISKWFGTATDISEAKRKEEELERLTQELASSNQELKRFAYIASHDLQEPLRAVTGFLGLLQRRYQGKLDREADEFIQFAVDGARRMHELIRGLLRYSRVETRGKPFEQVDTGAILARALANLQPAIQESGGRVEVGPLPVVRGDDIQLEQLFQNLVANGLKFRRQEPPFIRVEAERQQGGWRFAVRDNGIGIEPEYRERIFQLFQRLHTRDQYRGTGIGLTICQRIIERHGGRIWVESDPERGSTFYFILPD